MTALDDAHFVCGLIVAGVSAPIILVILPAMFQVLVGDWTAWNSLNHQGLGVPLFFAGILMCLTLVVGAALE